MSGVCRYIKTFLNDCLEMRKKVVVNDLMQEETETGCTSLGI